MVDAGPYLLSVLALALLAGSLGVSAVVLRRRLLPGWAGAPAYLVDSVVAVGLLVVLAEVLGLFGLLYGWLLVVCSVILLGAIVLWPSVFPVSPAGGVDIGVPSRVSEGAPMAATGPAGRQLSMLVALGAVAVVFALWGLTAVDALGRGIFNFDSLWYHLPFSVEMAQSHSVTGFHYPDTVFTSWFYPQNSELVHAVAILLTERDTLALFLNFGWLAMSFLAAWCLGRPYGVGPHSVVAAAIVLGSYTLVVREPGAAKNDVMAAALLLASIAILVNAIALRPRGGRYGGAGSLLGSSPGADAPVRDREPGEEHDAARRRHPHTDPPVEGGAPTDAWALAAAGLATGLAAGTKVTVLAMAGVLTVAVVAMAPRGWRWKAVGWWMVPALVGDGFWYLRNLVAVGNPLPQIGRLGPVSLPHPEQLQSARPDFNVAHYATDTTVWREYFLPGLEHAFGPLWPLVLAAALAAGLLALAQRRDRVLRWSGFVVLAGFVAYLFTPLGAAGLEGAPDGFRINLRFAVPALLAGIVLLPPALAAWLSHSSAGGRPWSLASWFLLAALTLTLLITNRADAVLRDPDRVAAWAIVALLVLIPAALLWDRRRGASRGTVLAGFAALTLIVAALGYSVQRDYLSDRFANADLGRAIPGMDLNAAYRWARGVGDARIGLAGTTAGFAGLGFYGTDLSNRVVYLGAKGPHGAFNPIPSCAELRAAVNAAELDYLVTAPFLNFIRPGEPIASPEARWLRGEPAVEPLLREDEVTVWRVLGPLDPTACAPRNAPLRQVPDQPTS